VAKFNTKINELIFDLMSADVRQPYPSSDVVDRTNFFYLIESKTDLYLIIYFSMRKALMFI
jgi:hypothetical protein